MLLLAAYYLYVSSGIVTGNDLFFAIKIIMSVFILLCLAASSRGGECTSLWADNPFIHSHSFSRGVNAPAYWDPASLIRPTPKKTPIA